MEGKGEPLLGRDTEIFSKKLRKKSKTTLREPQTLTSITGKPSPSPILSEIGRQGSRRPGGSAEPKESISAAPPGKRVENKTRDTEKTKNPIPKLKAQKAETAKRLFPNGARVRFE